MVESPFISDVMFCKFCKDYNLDDNTCTHQKGYIGYDEHCAMFDFDEAGYSSRKELIKQRQAKACVGTLKIDNFYDNTERLWRINPFFYDRNQLFWMWNPAQFRYEIVDETDILRKIDMELQFGGQMVSSSIKNSYLEAFRQVGRDHLPKDLPPNVIQFRDKFFDVNTKTISQVTPAYFACNPIPWNIGMFSETRHLDKLFEEWVGKDYVHTLYEMIAYCCMPSYPIPLIFALVGTGANGKSTLLRMLTKFIEVGNSTSCELDTLLESRFEAARLYKKLICFVGETNFGLLTKTSLLKKLTGSDLIGFEFKNKHPFEGYNYAKILISTNNLPVTEDTQDGFFRRWLVIQFPNQFTQSKDILGYIPDSEYEALARKVTEILPPLLSSGAFSKQGSFSEQKQRYISFSNPFGLFKEEKLIETKNQDDFIRWGDLYMAYVAYLQAKGVRVISKREFGKTLELDGLYVANTSKQPGGDGTPWIRDRWVEGLKWKNQPNLGFGTDGTLGGTFSLSYYTHVANREIPPKSSKSSKNSEVSVEFIDTSAENPIPTDISTYSKIYQDILRYIRDAKTGAKISDLSLYLDISFDDLCNVIDRMKATGVIMESPAGTVREL